jgi:hypothetical protein
LAVSVTPSRQNKETRACVADFIAGRIDIDGDRVAVAGAGFVADAGDDAACPCGSGAEKSPLAALVMSAMA